MPSDPASRSRAALAFQRLGLDPVQRDLGALGEAAVVDRLVEALVRVLVAGVLADDVDRDLAGGVLDAIDQFLPRRGPRLGERQAQLLEHDLVEPLALQDQRHFVDRGDVLRGDHGFLGDVAEERDLPLDVGVQEAIGAAQQHVGLDADRPEVAHAVLRRLGLQLSGRADEGHERQVDVERVLAADVEAELPDRLQERHAFDVADRAADLDQHDVHVAARLADGVLDLVGDVGNDLHRPAQVVAAALLLDHREVDLAGGPVAVPAGHHAGEPLVVAEVEVGLGAVVGDVHLAVLVRAHGAGVHVDIRVELLQRDLVAVVLEQAADRGGRQALAERRHHAAGDEDVFDRTSFRSLTHAPSRVPASRCSRALSKSSGVSTPTVACGVATVRMR